MKDERMVNFDEYEDDQHFDEGQDLQANVKPAPSYLNIGQVGSFNYFSGKSSNHGGDRRPVTGAASSRANESMESIPRNQRN